MRRDKLIKTALKDSYKRNRDDYIIRERHQDSIILWIVGLSSATVIVLLSNKVQVSNPYFQHVLYLFSASIVSGVLFRIIRYYLEDLELNTLNYGIHYLEVELTGATAPIDPNNAPAEVLLRSLTELGYDLSGLVDATMPIDRLRGMYSRFAEKYNEEEEKGIKDIYRFLGIFEGAKNPYEGKTSDDLLKSISKTQRRKAFRFIKDILYLLTTIIFIVAVIIGVTSFCKSLKSTDGLSDNNSYHELLHGHDATADNDRRSKTGMRLESV